MFRRGLQLEKKDLHQLSVLGQVEDKFIAVVTESGLLCLLDQHAVHERIRLEELLQSKSFYTISGM